ncbi:hypothetical protein NU10_09150 [Flavobacterium dauae]|uniref:hypothetical protein n=1 Tax=Flavobacterium dauae TaxID=1563479 RepID=UPI00101B3853|nr:hypothetical protein [Flavobacterium dauae]WLD22885.1 hypothetical protein NU10_09150 [Flavobacterium dauae]
MKERVSYIIGALIVYFIIGIILSYVTYSSFDLWFTLYWTICMTIADFFILRNIKQWLSKNKNN